MKWRDKQGTARRLALLGGILGVAGAVFGTGEEARAQIAGTNATPLPNVMLLIDSSGSMERMSDNTLPSDDKAHKADSTQLTSICSPGLQSQPNRWGMLVQALTGNLQPYFSCDAVARNTASFKNEFRIGGGVSNLPYDADYYLPYHRPLSGPDSINACAFAPSALPGAANGSGLGPAGLGAGGDASDFPTTAFQPFHETYLRSQYGLNTGLTNSATNTCIYDQATDGQLDAARDYVRFALMTFDNDPDPGYGTSTYPLPNGGNVLPGPTPSPFLGQWSYKASSANPNTQLGFGIPANCTTTPIPAFEVGSRNWAAPPWEGRMVRFPSPSGTLFDIENTNDQIQQVLMGMRPYGATPIDGMFEDARDYLWYNDYGPNGTQAATKDPYITNGGCRPQYLILLTDGAPNLDLRPSCEGTGAPNGICPYKYKAAQVADQMAQSTGSKFVQTYVIGFSVNNGDATRTFTNDGFPSAVVPPYNNCKGWYNQVTSNGSNPDAMHSICGPTNPTPPTKGSTADACCQLSEIAYYGTPSHNVPPFFAESQSDLVLSFGRVLGSITRSATTRTVPGYSPPVTISGQNVAADYIASFVPNALKVWSGEIDRTRTVCAGVTPTAQAESVSAGDSYAANLAAQASNRRFVSAQSTGATVDSLRTIRPFSTGADGVTASMTSGAQIVETTDMGLASSSAWADALGIDDTTCKRSRANDGTVIPNLTKMDCLKVIWGFATGTSQTISGGTPSYSKFNVRCEGAASAANAAQGTCSVSGNTCTLLTPGCGPGEVCVPKCSELGAIYRSSPQLVGPPNDLSRDDSYRAFADQRKFRRPAMFVATTDGVLHAFKALSSPWGGAIPPFDNIPNQFELWSFIPPAVLPRLASNYPTGQQILLDGTPNIKDVIWDRTLRNVAPLYHTTLASGLGAAGGGYYALSITDWDCQGNASTGIGSNPSACLGASAISTIANVNSLQATATQGPQFLWQLTDFPSVGAPSEVAKVSHTDKTGQQYVALFGKQSGNPVITTITANPDGNGTRDIGVVILPGGIDGTPIAGAGCPRAINSGSNFTFLATTYDQSDNVSPFGPRGTVRRWGADCKNSPVPGRNVTIVRADTGEIIKIFGRPQQDIPSRLNPLIIPSPFDSPIIGTPAVYPTGVGVAAQKVFVGDADGTIWRLDISSPNPGNWRATLFQDLVSGNLPGAPTDANSEPIQIPIELTQDPYGSVVINAATGDQENIVFSNNEKNYIYSIQEQPASLGIPGRARVRWYQAFNNGERVTGPLTVFDRALYFASYAPIVPVGGNCSVGGNATLWGEDYFNGNGGNNASTGVANNPGTGGAPMWCPVGSVDPGTGACAVGATAQSQAATAVNINLAGAIIPGVTVRAQPSCAQFTTGTDPAVTGISTTTYSLFFGATNSAGSSTTGSPQALRPGTTGVLRPLPRTAANIDSWAFVVD